MPTCSPASLGVEQQSAPVWVEGETLKPYLSRNTARFSERRGSSAYNSVTLSESYWNSQQNRDSHFLNDDEENHSFSMITNWIHLQK